MKVYYATALIEILGEKVKFVSRTLLDGILLEDLKTNYKHYPESFCVKKGIEYTTVYV